MASCCLILYLRGCITRSNPDEEFLGKKSYEMIDRAGMQI